MAPIDDGAASSSHFPTSPRGLPGAALECHQAGREGISGKFPKGRKEKKDRKQGVGKREEEEERGGKEGHDEEQICG